MDKKICNNPACKTENPIEAKFCCKCGTQLNRAAIITIEESSQEMDTRPFHLKHPELHLKPIEIKVVICEKRDSLNLRELKESPIIRLEYDTLSFGVIKGNLPVVKVINIKNCGNRDLIIRKIETDCTCTASIIEKRVIASNMSAPLEIMFKPMGRKGKQNRTITIFSNDVMKPVVKVPLQGYVE